jgi:hypothetical protein
MLCNNFPSAHENLAEEEFLDPHMAYRNCKIRLNTRAFYRGILEKDMKDLEADHQFKKSCGEPELLEFVQQAIEHTSSQLISLDLLDEADKNPKMKK